MIPKQSDAAVIRRRSILAGLAMPALAWTGRVRAAETPVLRVGDQKGGAQALMRAAGALDGVLFGVEWSQFSAAAPLLEALNAGAIDCGFAGDAPTTFALAAGVPARIIAATRSSGASTAIVVPDGSPIRTAADLKGRAIGTNRGSIGHSLVLAVAHAQGWSAGDVELANLLPSEARAALTRGAIEAWSSWGVYIAQARLADRARIVVDGTDGLLTGLSYLLAREAAIEARRAALLDFCKRLVAARRWAIGHRAEYAAALATEIGVEIPVARLMFETETPVPALIDDSVIRDQQTTIDRFTAAKLVRSNRAARDLFDPSFNGALG